MSSAIDIIIQARMGATRLPGKTLMPFANTSILEYLVSSVRRSKWARQVIVATTVEVADDVIEDLCRRRGYTVFRGSEEDVLGRYRDAASTHASDIIVRVTADNPFTDVTELDRLIEVLKIESLDYIGNHQGGTPSGVGSEVFTHDALEKAYQNATLPSEREHVTPYFYHHPDGFKQKQLSLLTTYPDSTRLTVDTPEDYAVVCEIADLLGLSEKQFATPNSIVSALTSNQSLMKTNKHIIQKKVTDH